MDRKELWAKLQAKGEAQVRKELMEGKHGQTGSPRYFEVNEWLRLQAESRSDASNREQITIARSARNAAWAAAIAAIIAAISAVISLSPAVRAYLGLP